MLFFSGTRSGRWRVTLLGRVADRAAAYFYGPSAKLAYHPTGPVVPRRIALSHPRNATRRRSQGQRAALKLIVLGVALAAAPWILGDYSIGRALAPLSNVGLTVAAAGALLVWLASRGRRSAGRATHRAGRAGVSSPDAVAAGTDRRLHRAEDRVADAIDSLSARPHTTSANPPARPTEWSGAVFEVIEWRRFEALIEALFEQAGFQTKALSHGADGGVDVWLYAPGNAEQPVGIVQCKHHRKRIGVDKVRELRGVMAACAVRRGQFASTSGFTIEAETFARENGINMLGGAGLLSMIAKRSPTQQLELLAVATEGEFWRPTCASCGTKMVRREPSRGGLAFWGCTSYPSCRSTLPMRDPARCSF